ncbi:YdeI/OmpD-associated family protein [Streptococcus entericus]|uniref:YdeI/OmpD-associated family protein n=1 Tax=Streptococcus entericus TaxID=155680 RepID=UPI00037E03A9|nr:YdeI/OmpD-associated family protein [Streptococcus entericus]
MNPNEKTIIEEIETMLQAHPTALTYWRRLSPSHQHEYIKWIDEAKKEETKQKRKEKTVEILLEKYS